MKKLVALAAVAFLSLSCSDEDNTVVNTDEEITIDGTWNLTSFNLEQAIDLNNDGTESTDMIAETGCFNNSSLVFDTEDSVLMNFQEIDIDLDIVTGTEDMYEFAIECLDAITETATYNVVGNQVFITIQDEDNSDLEETIILTQSENTLTVTIPEYTEIPDLFNDDEENDEEDIEDNGNEDEEEDDNADENDNNEEDGEENDDEEDDSVDENEEENEEDIEEDGNEDEDEDDSEEAVFLGATLIFTKQ
ncbi:MAG: hypothetical protein BM557_03125 [Flavobacterium sp. MedPE-SWcel]|mgnify:CR=1 FL=1|uniref:DUF5004 domain-containing protein n=1 Tax=uncultured Flavobacterium sp. TaxID=165435 RepID=UPI000910C4E4|nr:DUF5004 domain-containing protein [uncultured Flavobacterium sp.]OIQ21799.1 MAG: hypothetical protein BM557_03125 [Flavobacterium sp. MedPE-SWcel]